MPARPVQPAEAEAAANGTVPDPRQIRPNVWVLPAPFLSRGQPLRYTLSYLLVDGEGGAHLIDPGIDSEENAAGLARQLESIGSSLAALRTIVATHLHWDHLGLAERLRDQTGATIVLHRLEQATIDGLFGRLGDDRFDRWGVPADRRGDVAGAADNTEVKATVTADRLVDDGEILRLGDIDLEAIWTPGHTYGHLSLRLAAARLIFTGDHVLPGMNPGLGLGGPSPTNPIDDYLASLEKIAGFDDHEVCPGHLFRFTGLTERCAELGEHHRRRTADVVGVLADDPEADIWTVASKLGWSTPWDDMTKFIRSSALAQTEMHVQRARATAGPR
jgi:glyoxylase-like metal-dependent hydrolase (beta-lactamase superfamily II)